MINNAIQAEKFSFSEKDRDSLRKELGWENKTVIGHVGRFDIPKNHDRMLDIFQQIVSEKKDVMLCLVGPKEGLYKEIKEKTVQKGLEDKVYFAGKQENIRRYLSAMDVFLFPSVFEGVPFALIEAQANGLACVMSEAVDVYKRQGMGMAGQAGGANMQNLYQMGAQQQAAQQQAAQNMQPASGAGTWKCECGAENTGKFCSECGKPKRCV